ncbi:MAG: hypothetical protein IH858_02110 [Chloroflexi bacterium]|nr:hypothetical protein [Chloroflexota bacterium]
MGNGHDHHNHEHGHHDHEHRHEEPQAKDKEGVTFNHEGTNYTEPLEAAQNSGIVGNADRIQLPGGQLIMLHPHAHEDNANSSESIKEKGGKIWPVK